MSLAAAQRSDETSPVANCGECGRLIETRDWLAGHSIYGLDDGNISNEKFLEWGLPI